MGAIGAGKSEVARMFGELGALVVDVDVAAHRALQRGDVRQALARTFGERILRPDGTVDRRALAEAAFAGPERTRRLNRIVHPHVKRAIRRAMGKANGRIVVVDAALLQEAGADRDCDAVVYVHAPRALRERRVRSRRGWSAAEMRRRERRQWPAWRKRAAADAVVDNSGPRSRTRAQVRALWNAWNRLLRRSQ